MSDLIKAAEVFNINVPDWLDDSVKVGTIAGVAVFAGELRRLTKALTHDFDAQLRSQVVSYLESRDLIRAIKLVREKLPLGLAEAKDYVEKIGVEIGVRKLLDVADYSWPHKSRPYAWVEEPA